MHISDQAAKATQGEAGRCHILFCGQNTVRMLKGSVYAPHHAFTFGLWMAEILLKPHSCCLCRPAHSTSVKATAYNLADKHARVAQGLMSLFQRRLRSMDLIGKVCVVVPGLSVKLVYTHASVIYCAVDCEECPALSQQQHFSPLEVQQWRCQCTETQYGVPGPHTGERRSRAMRLRRYGKGNSGKGNS